MAAGEAIGCFGLTEPDAGSDPGSMRTRARRDGDDWILHGQKMWITNGSVAEVAVVWARDRRGRARLPRPARAPRASPPRTSTRSCRLRASITSELLLDDVRLPADARCPRSTSLRGPLSCLNEARYGIVWGAVGAARACFEAALDYAKERDPVRQADRRPSRSSSRSSRRWRSRSTGRRCWRCTSGGMKDEGTPAPRARLDGQARQRQRRARRRAHAPARCSAPTAITLEYPVIRHMNNLESVVTYEGTADVHALVDRRRADRHPGLPLAQDRGTRQVALTNPSKRQELRDATGRDSEPAQKMRTAGRDRSRFRTTANPRSAGRDSGSECRSGGPVDHAGGCIAGGRNAETQPAPSDAEYTPGPPKIMLRPPCNRSRTTRPVGGRLAVRQQTTFARAGEPAEQNVLNGRPNESAFQRRDARTRAPYERESATS